MPTLPPLTRPAPLAPDARRPRALVGTHAPELFTLRSDGDTYAQTVWEIGDIRLLDYFALCGCVDTLGAASIESAEYQFERNGSAPFSPITHHYRIQHLYGPGWNWTRVNPPYVIRAYDICLAYHGCTRVSYSAKQFMLWRALRYREYLAVRPEHGWYGSRNEVDILRDEVAQAFDEWLEAKFPPNGFHADPQT